MSHFLERLAAGVAAPATGPRLRPLPGSIYAPLGARRSDEPVMLMEAAEATAAARSELFASSRAENRAFRSDRLDESSTREKVNGESARSHVSANAESLEILLPVARPADRVLHSPDMPAAEERDFPRHPGEDSARRSGQEQLVKGREISRDEEYASVRDVTVKRSEALLRATPAVVQTGHVRAQAAGEQPLRSTTGETREADEITIHIGRVEVAAVMQPVMRPVTAPARRAMSLDEYLKRGNGRAR